MLVETVRLGRAIGVRDADQGGEMKNPATSPRRFLDAPPVRDVTGNDCQLSMRLAGKSLKMAPAVQAV